MRKSKYLILSPLYFKFNKDISKIDEVKQLFDTQNILDLLRFNKLYTIFNFQFENKNINFIYFPNNISHLSESAFRQSKIQYINFSNSKNISYIGCNTFLENKINILNLYNCLLLNEIASDSFSKCEIKYIKLPQSVEYVNSYAFQINKIKYIDFTRSISIKNIESYAFKNNQLEEIKILNNIEIKFVTNIEDDIWNKFVLYYNETGKRAGDYKYENDKWKWYPL